MRLVDCTDKAPKQYRVRMREPDELVAVVLHQTGLGKWSPENPMWYRVRAHYLVMQSGEVRMLHHPLTRMRYGSGQANAYSVAVEHEGSYPSDRGKWYKPERYGASVLADHPEQVRASRELLRTLVEQYPSLRTLYAHRHLSRSRSNCPGPDLWREVGCWAIDELGLVEGEPRYGGMALPDTWRGGPTMALGDECVSIPM